MKKKSPIRIGFDLDKIFIDTPPLVPDRIIDYFYKNKKKKALSYRIPKKPEQIIRLLSHASFMRPLIRSNYEYVRKMSLSEKHQQFLISSRFSFLRKKTDRIIFKNTFTSIFHSMFFNYQNQQPHLFKEKVLRNLKLNKYIDDDLDLLNHLAKKYKTTKFYWLNEKVEKKLSANLFAVKKIEDVFK